MYYVLFYRTVEDYIERRAAYRGQHLALARASHDRGELFLAGALADPPDQALLVFKGDSPAMAEEFARSDPYVLNGLVSEWKVRPWTVVTMVTDNLPSAQTQMGDVLGVAGLCERLNMTMLARGEGRLRTSSRALA
jgi:uncharacterized protein YciI